MKYLFRILMFCFMLFLGNKSFGQDSLNKIFESSKGTWSLPLKKYLYIEDNEQMKHYTAYQFDSTLRIVTDSLYSISAVHDGEIVILFSENNNTIIVTQFGDYYLTYWNLSKTDLKVGDKIIKGQVIGKIFSYYNSNTIRFDISLQKNYKELCAEKWFDRKQLKFEK